MVPLGGRGVDNTPVRGGWPSNLIFIVLERIIQVIDPSVKGSTPFVRGNLAPPKQYTRGCAVHGCIIFIQYRCQKNEPRYGILPCLQLIWAAMAFQLWIQFQNLAAPDEVSLRTAGISGILYGLVVSRPLSYTFSISNWKLVLSFLFKYQLNA